MTATEARTGCTHDRHSSKDILRALSRWLHDRLPHTHPFGLTQLIEVQLGRLWWLLGRRGAAEAGHSRVEAVSLAELDAYVNKRFPRPPAATPQQDEPHCPDSALPRCTFDVLHVSAARARETLGRVTARLPTPPAPRPPAPRFSYTLAPWLLTKKTKEPSF